MFFAKFNKSCLITYFGVIFGVLSMHFAFSYMSCQNTYFISYSLVCLIISGVCDMFDGKFARACKRTEEEKAFGIQLDSLADTFCFLAVPIVFMLSLGMNEWYHNIAYALLSLCGVSRLGYFNVNADLDNAVKVYHGLPVTSTAIVYPILGILGANIGINGLRTVYFIATLLVAFLMIVNIKLPKFTGVWYKIIPVLAILLITLLFMVK